MKSILIYSLLILLLVSCRGSWQADPKQSEVKIVNGSLVELSDPTIKTTVAIFPSSRAASPHCTGTLIGKNHVVTAAHCLKSKPYKIGFGLKGKDTSFKVSGYKIHPSYSRWRQTFDVGVVTFEGTIDSSKHVPVGLAQASEGMEIIVTGYGVTGERRSDSGTLRTVQTTVGKLIGSSKEFMSSRDGKGACFGDSGGPVYIIEDGRYKVIGATSRGASCEVGDGIYTDVGRHKEWLKQAFSDLNVPFEDVDAATSAVSPEKLEGGSVSPSLSLKLAFEDVAKGSYIWVSTDKNTSRVIVCANSDDCEKSSSKIELVRVSEKSDRRLFFRTRTTIGVKERIKLTILSYDNGGGVLKKRDVNVKAR